MRRPLIALLAMAAALDGCASSPSGAPAPRTSAPAADTAWLALTGYKECQWEDPRGRASRPAIVRYYPTTTDSIHRPFRIIMGANTGLCSPAALAVGPAGELFVLNHAPRAPRPDSAGRWEQWVTVYDSSAGGDVSPVRVLRVQLAWLGYASSMHVDDEGRLFLGSRVADVIDEGSIAVFEPGADGDAKPSRVIAGSGTGLYRPAAIALDRGGFVYVLNSSDEMPLRYLVRERRTPTGFPAFVRKQPQELNAVLVFRPGVGGEVAPVRVIAGERTGLSAPVSLALDRGDRLYVANNLELNGQVAVTVYAPSDTGDAAPVKRLTDPRDFTVWGRQRSWRSTVTTPCSSRPSGPGPSEV
jgi:hypothetical protein